MPVQSASNAILAEVTAIARSVFEDPSLELTLETTSDDVPLWASLAHIALVVEAECHFDIRFQVAEIEEIKNVGELVRLIHAKLEMVAA
jgi:acyl carrier protein